MSINQPTQESSPSQSAVLNPQSFIRLFAVAAVIASATELLFQRGLSRLGASLTMSGAEQSVIDIFTLVNRIAGYSLNLAIVLCWTTVALSIWGSWQDTLNAAGGLRWLRLAATIGLAALLIYTPVLFLTSRQGDAVYEIVAYATLLLIIAVGVAQARDWQARLVLILMAVAYFADAYYVLANSYFAGQPLHSLDVYNVGQLLVMVNGLLLFVFYALRQRPSRFAIVFSVLAMVLLAGMFLAPMKVDVPAYIVTFSSGYQFALPWPFYVLVLGAVVYTIVNGFRGSDKGWQGSTALALGLLMIAIAGYDLKLDLQFYQAAVGLILLTGMTSHHQPLNFNQPLVPASEPASERTT